MANTIVLTKRTGGGFKAVINGQTTRRFSKGDYEADDFRVKIFAAGGVEITKDAYFTPETWNIDNTGNFGTIDAVCQALEGIGILRASEPVIGASTEAKQDLMLTALGLLSTASKQDAALAVIKQCRRINKIVTMTITRVADQAVYAAGDILGGTLDMTELMNLALETGANILFKKAQLITNDTGLSGKKVEVHFYNNDVRADYVDNAVMDYDAHPTEWCGYMDFAMGATGWSTKKSKIDYQPVTVNPVAKTPYVIVALPEGLTPSANSTWFKFKFDVELTN